MLSEMGCITGLTTASWSWSILSDSIVTTLHGLQSGQSSSWPLFGNVALLHPPAWKSAYGWLRSDLRCFCTVTHNETDADQTPRKNSFTTDISLSLTLCPPFTSIIKICFLCCHCVTLQNTVNTETHRERMLISSVQTPLQVVMDRAISQTGLWVGFGSTGKYK